MSEKLECEHGTPFGAECEECIASIRSEYDSLKVENKILKNVIEPKVEELEHWVGRAEKAEAEVQVLRKALVISQTHICGPDCAKGHCKISEALAKTGGKND